MKSYLRFFLLAILPTVVLFGGGCEQKKPDNNACVMKIDTVPPGAAVIVAGEAKGRTPLRLRSARPIRALFKFEHEGYLPAWEPVDFRSGVHELKVKLKPVSAEVLIVSEPSDAQVEYNGHVVGDTPLVLRRLPPGNGSAIIRKPGYTEREAIWKIKDPRPQLISLRLASNISSLQIESTPDEAAVYLDDMNCGTTPLAKKVEPGKHRLRVVKPGYIDFEEIIICRRGERFERRITLHERPGGLNITSVPAGAQVSVNDIIRKTTPCVIDDLEPGKYKIKVEKEGYDPDVREITLAAGQQCEFKVDLGRNTGNIDLVVNPPGVTIYVDGRKIGVTEPDESRWLSKVIHLRDLKDGIHVITLAHKRAQPSQRIEKIRVRKGQTIRPKTINIWIANAELKHRDGRTMIGCLRDETPLVLIFEPERGVRQELRRDEIVSLKILKDEE